MNITSPRFGALSAAAGGGSGDFVGPASATDGAPVLFDGAGGKLGKNSTPALLLAFLGAGFELVTTATVAGSPATEIDTGVFSPAGVLGDRYLVWAQLEINGACSIYCEMNGRTTTTDYYRGVCGSGIGAVANSKPENEISSTCKYDEISLIRDNFFNCFTAYTGGHAYPGIVDQGAVSTSEKFSRIRWYTSVAARIAVGSKITVWRFK